MQSMIAFAANMGNLVGSTFWTFVIYDARADACGSTGVFCPGSCDSWRVKLGDQLLTQGEL